MNLNAVFKKVTHKVLSEVETNPGKSHQHEINVGRILDFFPEERRKHHNIRWIYFSDEQDPISENLTFNIYDSRENDSSRSAEWRMYYSGDFIWDYGNESDLLILLLTSTDEFVGLIFDSESAWIRPARLLFNIESESTNTFLVLNQESLVSTDIEFYRKIVLQELGLDNYLPEEEKFLEYAFEKFGHFIKLPGTREMALAARDFSKLETDTPPDVLLTNWLDIETSLFHSMESHLVKKRIAKGFTTTDEFFDFSLSMINGRKSRRGFSLENQLEKIFNIHSLSFNRNPKIEGNKKPDFLFPGKTEYENQHYPIDSLFVLGAKSTCKDRWRQVLNESNRIKKKHLCTLEASISRNQTNEMKNSNLCLVVPTNILQTYTDEQREDMLNIEQFIGIIQRSQNS
ncbi:MAG: hypothetical protein K8R40_05415 [Anaerolineaceae bacterium]|nr:hypothetical protein [Anaerolineaceae bacterium]